MPSKPVFSSFIGFSKGNLKIGRFVGVGIIIARVLQTTVLKSDLNSRNKLEKKSMLLSQNPSMLLTCHTVFFLHSWVNRKTEKRMEIYSKLQISSSSRFLKLWKWHFRFSRGQSYLLPVNKD